MATQETTSHFAGPHDPALIELVWEAASESTVLCELILRELKKHGRLGDFGFEVILATALHRIKVLSDAASTALEDGTETAALHDIVHHEASNA